MFVTPFFFSGFVDRLNHSGNQENPLRFTPRPIVRAAFQMVTSGALNLIVRIVFARVPFLAIIRGEAEIDFQRFPNYLILFYIFFTGLSSIIFIYFQ
jgi:hypothetical protein